MANSPQLELLNIQQQLYRRNEEVIESSILIQEPDFARYEKAYRRHVARYQALSSQDEMMAAILASEIIYVGDYHTLNQSQRSFLRILKAAVIKDKKMVVCLELLHARYQPLIDRFLKGTLGEEKFLKDIKLKEHWVFDLWQNFKPIFDFCRYHKLPIYGIDAAVSGSTVRERDAATAELLTNITAKHPGHRLFVLIGDLHVAPQHLPKDTELALKRRKLKRRHLLLTQNSPAIYWKLAKEGLVDRVEVVRINDRSFCRMHTPPIIGQYSYLQWLDHEEGEIDFADAKHEFTEIVHRIAGFIGLGIAPADLEDVEVFTAGDLSFLRRLKEAKHFTAQELATIKAQILSSESYYIAKSRMVYLATLSLNHAAEEATHFIKHMKSGDEEPRELVDAFYANILHEALGFWGSKIINHKRKCHDEADYKSLMAYFKTIEVPAARKLEEESAELILEMLRLQKKRKPFTSYSIFSVRMDLFLAVTHALGYMLGDRLYYGLIDRQVSKKDIRDLFTDAWKGEGRPYDVYRRLGEKLKKVKIPKRM
ncbi:MAG: ChaN family lipoprotein [Deltaproteobacteria bacterium]|nr:ChaN family lipoprotein [Deltaproteobacteria bacterium]